MHALPSSICLHPSFCHCSIIFSMEGTGRKRPGYSCPDMKDDVVEELIDRCDVITSASMAGSFKTILDSTNNIITRNPRVQEQFDIPYLLRRDPADWRAGEISLALCKLMPLDNDTYDVNMPSLEGKAWAGAKWRLGCLYWVQLRVGTCECVHSSSGSTSNNLRLPRG